MLSNFLLLARRFVSDHLVISRQNRNPWYLFKIKLVSIWEWNGILSIDFFFNPENALNSLINSICFLFFHMYNHDTWKEWEFCFLLFSPFIFNFFLPYWTGLHLYVLFNKTDVYIYFCLISGLKLYDISIYLLSVIFAEVWCVFGKFDKRLKNFSCSLCLPKIFINPEYWIL